MKSRWILGSVAWFSLLLAVSLAGSPANSIWARQTETDKTSSESRLREQLDRRMQTFERDLADLKRRVEAAETKEEKVQLVRSKNPVPAYVDDLLDLSATAPETDAALDAVLEAVARAKGDRKDRAMTYLLKAFCDRLDLPKIVDTLLEQIPAPETDRYFQMIVEGSKDDQATAYALLGYAQYVKRLPYFRRAFEANPQLARKLPSSQREYLFSHPDEPQRTRSASYLQRLIDQFGSVRRKGQLTYGEVAEAELYELQHLSVGMVAPEIVGRDLDGTEFRLSDYRGKVVMLDFWGHWCFPCRKMYAHERHLVERLAAVPFALIGVNTDRKLETVQSAVAEDHLTWRNFWDGPQGTAGPISRRWNIDTWPTVYLIDAKGVIRYKGILGDDIDAAIESLLDEMGYATEL